MYLEEQLDNLTNVIKQGLAELVETIRAQGTTQHVERVVAKPNGAAQETPTEVVETKGPSYAEVLAIAQKLAQVKGPGTASKLIHKHGGGKLADMPEKLYPAFMASAQVLLSEPTPEL
jgi:hypothetical protein